MTEARMTTQEQGLFTRFIYELTGIVLDETDVYLVETRLEGLLKTLGCGTYSELLYKVRNDTAGSLKNAVIDRVTTQETCFFRDQAPFEMFKSKILTELVDARRRQYRGQLCPLRIWSAACATGQEVYSIAIALKEALGDLSGYALEILGTDISDAAVAKASSGTYTAFEVGHGLPEGLRDKYFRREGGEYRAVDGLRALAAFRKLNLHEDFTALGRWDVIFCRNVASYFSEADKKNLFLRLHAALEQDGALVIGSTEPLLGICPEFVAKRYGRSVFYSKV